MDNYYPSSPFSLEQLEPTENKSHSRRPLFWVCLAFIVGIIINRYSNFSLGSCLPYISVGLFIGLLLKRKFVATLFLLMAVIVGSAEYCARQERIPIRDISKISYGVCKYPVLVEGKVVSDVELRPFFRGKKTVFILEVSQIKTQWGWQRKSGQVLVNLFRKEDLAYGDCLILTGKLHRPFNFSRDSSFSYREYLRRQGINFILSVKKSSEVEILKRNQGFYLKSWSLRLKKSLNGVLKDYLPKDEAGLMQALVLGDRYDIPREVYDLFKISGVAHIIAISGFNIGIVTYIISLLFKVVPIPRKAKFLLTIGLLIFYAFLTGGQPPVVRATIMAVVFLASYIFERETESINTLSLSALIILLMNPLNLFDVGFQLSFISVLAIIILYPRLMNFFYRLFPWADPVSKEKSKTVSAGKMKAVEGVVTRYFLQSAALSLSAYVGVAILIAYYFRLVTPIVLLANLVVVPLASVIIFLGMGLLILGMISHYPALILAKFITLLFKLMIASVGFFVQVPGAYFPVGSFSLLVVFGYYGMLILLYWGWGKFRRYFA